MSSEPGLSAATPGEKIANRGPGLRLRLNPGYCSSGMSVSTPLPAK